MEQKSSKFDILMIEPNRKYQWIQEVHHSIQLKHSTITTDKSVSRIASLIHPCLECLAYGLDSEQSKVVQLISGPWEQWWLNPHGGTSCLWNCLCSPEEPSCLYQSLVSVTGATDVNEHINTRDGTDTAAQITCHILIYLSPHLPNILKNHVAMPIKCPHTTK